MSDCITEAEGVYDPNAKKKKKNEEKGECNYLAIYTFIFIRLVCYVIKN